MTFQPIRNILSCVSANWESRTV